MAPAAVAVCGTLPCRYFSSNARLASERRSVSSMTSLPFVKVNATGLMLRDGLRQQGNSGIVEEVMQAQLQLEGIAQTGEDPNRQQGVSAHIEEVVKDEIGRASCRERV